MPYKKIEIHKLNLNNRYKKLKEISHDEYMHIMRFINKSKVENDITDKTERKYIDALVMAINILGNNFKKITRKDLENMKVGLRKGQIKTRFGYAYSDTSQREMTLLLSRYLEWRFPKKFSDLRKWFVIKTTKKTPEVLSEEEVEQLYKACQATEDRFLISVLFDTGFRASEFLNIRYEDVIKPTSDFPYYRIDLKGEYSKTEGRIIGLYWKLSTEAIIDYLAESDESDPKKQVFSKNYDAIRMFVSRLGRKILHKRVHLHMFRKSSATYYAPKMNRQQLCYRYGWKFSSNVPDVYIARAGMKEEDVKQKIHITNMEKLQKENQELQTMFALMKDSSEKEIEDLRKRLNTLEGGKGIMTLLVNLAQQQKQMSVVLEEVSGKRFDMIVPNNVIENNNTQFEKRK